MADKYRRNLFMAASCKITGKYSIVFSIREALHTFNIYQLIFGGTSLTGSA